MRSQYYKYFIQTASNDEMDSLIYVITIERGHLNCTVFILISVPLRLVTSFDYYTPRGVDDVCYLKSIPQFTTRMMRFLLDKTPKSGLNGWHGGTCPHRRYFFVLW